MACGILVPHPGIEHGPSAAKAWTARELPELYVSGITPYVPFCVFYSFLHVFLKILIEIVLIYNIVSVSGVQQSDIYMYIYIYPFSYIPFHYRLLQDLEYSSRAIR